MSNKPKILVFASGTKDGGGSGFQNLVMQSQVGVLDAEIVGVISNHRRGGVYNLATTLGIPFHHMPQPYNAETYQDIIHRAGGRWFALSGWLKLVEGLPPQRTINIHPGPLPEYGGLGMYGHHVHEAVIRDFKAGKITASAVTMHFVTPDYDQGPIFFHFPVFIKPDDTPENLSARVNAVEHSWQPHITNLVVQGNIRLRDGTVVLPAGYPFTRK